MLDELIIGGVKVLRGEYKRFELEVARLFDFTAMSLPLEVIRGKADGPTLFLSAAIHGDEINGVEIIKRLINQKKVTKVIKGTLICAPIVNVYGFNNNMRYLPDRRDLNRCFPGNENGSMGSQIAHIFMKEIVSKCTHGIDLQTGALHRKNLPHIKASMGHTATRSMAHAFGIPLMIDARVHDGSLREAVQNLGIPMILFEGGEALRYDEKVIKMGLEGIISVMASIGMLPKELKKVDKKPIDRFVVKSSYWVRAPHSGSLRRKKVIGDMVKEDEVLGEISDVFGSRTFLVKAEKEGIILGMCQLPLVNNGDALFHIATLKAKEFGLEYLEAYDDSLTNIP